MRVWIVEELTEVFSSDYILSSQLLNYLVFARIMVSWFFLIALPISCRASVLEKASKSVWDLILDNNGLGKEISETVERVFCRLSGQEPPLFPLLNGEPQPDKEADSRKEKGKGKHKENENICLITPLKKRSFSEANSDGADETATRTSDPVAISEGSGKSPLLISKT
jgi:hypothetical protein